MRPSAEHASQLYGNKPMLVAEVGVRSGENAIDMLNGIAIDKLFLVDNYMPYMDGDTLVDAPIQSRYYYKMFKDIRPYFEKVVLVTKSSMMATGLFEDGFFDYVYIDANHQYEFVLDDLNYWWPKVKVGGCFAGHDFPFIGVKKALDEFVKKMGLTYIVKDQDWIINK